MGCHVLTKDVGHVFKDILVCCLAELEFLTKILYTVIPTFQLFQNTIPYPVVHEDSMLYY